MRRVFFVILVMLLGCSFGWAQPPLGETVVTPVGMAKTPPPEWGTTAYTVFAMDAMGFTPMEPGVTWGVAPGYMKVCTNGPCLFFHSVHVPSGAQVTGIEVEGCDNHANINLFMGLYYCHSGYCTAIPDDDGVESDGAPGCNYFTRWLATPVTVDNNNGTYLAMISTSAVPEVQFRGARVYYKLQVSPAPATATFADVPTTSPFFKYVEALYASGLIAGCGGGNYCPTNPVTRGQMAVYLAGALGMHWPY